ncbi:MAG: hypothetical protein ACXAAO_10780 [Candidatus Thorarchaeota archaeon]|jgi:hypothetical protein
MTTFKLLKNEVRMIFNQFRQAVTTPSMILFYGITFFGIFFVSSVITSLVAFAPLLGSLNNVLEESLDVWMVYTATAILSLSSVVSGYFGIGPASVLTDVDESLLMSMPVKPHQIFLSRYGRRIIRKVSFIFLGLLAVLPLLNSAGLLFLTAITVIVVFIIFLEINYLLGSMSSYVRIWLGRKTKNHLRHLALVLLGFLILLPATPWLIENFQIVLITPSNALALSITEFTGIFSQGTSPIAGVILIMIDFLICLLIVAHLTGYDYYEVFSAVKGQEQTEGRFSKVIRGDVDFSNSRFTDPMIWIMLKDFWSRLRSPMQIWKYIYAGVGTVFVLYLNIVRPIWFPAFLIPVGLAFAIVPAFILMMIMFIQMSSVTALLGFVDERDNVYLLKASPFRSRDIIFAKYLLSLFEVTVAVIPACGFLIYLLHIEGYLAIITLTAPLVLLFTASGNAIGAYVPVMSNDPQTLPVPLAFSFPIINLGLGTIMVYLVAIFADSWLVIVILPIYTLSLVYFFLAASVHALGTYK